MDRPSQADVVTVLDGALGTEIERRLGPLPPPLWSAEALRSAPELVTELHRAYVAAGAQLLVANTFRTNPRAIQRAGLSARDGAALTALAVDCARRAAAGRPGVRVAGSIAPVEDCYRPELVPPVEELAAEHEQMAAWLAEAGVDLAWIETIGSVREACSAARAAHRAGLPFGVSFITRADEPGASAGRPSLCLLSGEPLAEALGAVTELGAVHVGLNCIPPRGVTQQLPRLRRLTALPIAVYAHLSRDQATPGWPFAEDAAPAQYGGCARLWRQLGAGLIGGCCGTTPEHIRAVAQALCAGG